MPVRKGELIKRDQKRHSNWRKKKSIDPVKKERTRKKKEQNESRSKSLDLKRVDRKTDSDKNTFLFRGRYITEDDPDWLRWWEQMEEYWSIQYNVDDHVYSYKDDDQDDHECSYSSPLRQKEDQILSRISAIKKDISMTSGHLDELEQTLLDAEQELYMVQEGFW